MGENGEYDIIMMLVQGGFGGAVLVYLTVKILIPLVKRKGKDDG